MSSTNGLTPEHPVVRFQALFATLRPDVPMPVEQVYTPDILFEDPLHRLEGIEQLRAYFTRLNAQLIEGTFEFQDAIIGENRAALPWVMTLRLRRLPKPVIVQGCSHIVYTTHVSHQRDYFDAGALIYEQVPLLGFFVKQVKAALQRQ